MLKGFVEQALWKYTSIFLAQPFEVVKTVLQVHVATGKHKSIARDAFAGDGKRRHGSYRRSSYDVRDHTSLKSLPFAKPLSSLNPQTLISILHRTLPPPLLSLTRLPAHREGAVDGPP